MVVLLSILPTFPDVPVDSLAERVTYVQKLGLHSVYNTACYPIKTVSMLHSHICVHTSVYMCSIYLKGSLVSMI